MWVHAQLVAVGQQLIAELQPQVYISNEKRFGVTPRVDEVRSCVATWLHEFSQEKAMSSI